VIRDKIIATTVEKNSIGYTKMANMWIVYIKKFKFYMILFFLSCPQYKEFDTENFTLLGYIIDYV
jgi:hypothetical protein